MTRDIFIDTCVQGGYCNRIMATVYTQKNNKEVFTLDDCIELYRRRERALDISMGIDSDKFKDGFNQNRGKFKTTKRYKKSERMGSDKNE